MADLNPPHPLHFDSKALESARSILGVQTDDPELSKLLNELTVQGISRDMDPGRLIYELGNRGVNLTPGTDLSELREVILCAVRAADPENPLRRTLEKLDSRRKIGLELRELRKCIGLEFEKDLKEVQAELRMRERDLADIRELRKNRPEDKDLLNSEKTRAYKLGKAQRKAGRYKGCRVGKVEVLSPLKPNDRFRLEGGEWEREPINYLIEGPSLLSPSEALGGASHSMDIRLYAIRSFSETVLNKVIEEGWRVEVNQLSPFSFARSLVERGFVECFRVDTIKHDFDRYVVANPETGEKMLVVHLLEGQSLRTQIEGSLLLYTNRDGKSISPDQIKIWRTPQSLQQRFKELLEVHDVRPDTVVFGHQELVRSVFEKSLGIMHEREIDDRNLAATIYRIRQDGRIKTVLSINMAPGLFGDRIGAFAEAVLQRGARSFVFMGTAGGLQGSGLRVGDIVLPETVAYVGEDNPAWINNEAISEIATTLEGYNIKAGGVHVSVSSPVEEDNDLIKNLQKRHCTVDCEVRHLVCAIEQAGKQGHVNLGIAIVVTDLPGTEQELNAKGLGIDNHYEDNSLPVTDLGMYIRAVFAGATSVVGESAIAQVFTPVSDQDQLYKKTSTKSGTSFIFEGKWGKLSILFPHSQLTSFLHTDYKRAMTLFEDTIKRRFKKSDEVGRLELLKTVIPLMSFMRYTYDIDLEIRHSSRSAMEIRDGLGLNRYQRYLSEVSVGIHSDGLEKLPDVTNKRSLRAFARLVGASKPEGGKEFLLGCLGLGEMATTGVTPVDPRAIDYELVVLAAINLKHYSLTVEELQSIKKYIYGHLKKGRLEACEISLFLSEHPDLSDEHPRLADFLIRKLPSVNLDLQTVYVHRLYRLLGRDDFKVRMSELLNGLDPRLTEVAASLLGEHSDSHFSKATTKYGRISQRYDPALVLGVMYGAATGDAVGAPFEFVAKKDIVAILGDRNFDYEEDAALTDFRLQSGSITDDTRMGLIIAESMIDRGELDPFDIANRYGKEVIEIDEGTKMNPGYSGGMLHTMRRCYLGCHPLLAGRARANGCGAAMRVFALPLMAESEEQLIEWAAITAEMTHNSEIGRASAVTMAVGLRYLLELRKKDQFRARLDKDDFLDYLERAAGAYSVEFAEYISLLKDLHEVNPGVTLQLLGTSGRAVETVPSAIYCFLHSPDSLQEILRNAVVLDGDSDSIASMACALYGAWHGINGFSQKWRVGLGVTEEILKLSERMAQTH